MTIIFWNFEGALLVDCLECRKTVTGSYYIEVLRKLRAELAKKCEIQSIVTRKS